MQKKLNEDFIDDYCEEFVSKVCRSFFADGKGVITGKDILNLTPSKQVNFFAIKLLFRYWQEETKKLRSPFFNYKNEEVRRAMTQFMNVLSRHIEVEEDKFKMLLNHALKDTIYLAVAPATYIKIELEGREVNQIGDKSIEETVKYLKIHKQKISDFLKDMKGQMINDVPDELLGKFEAYDTSEAVDKECILLSKILPIDKERLLSHNAEIDDFEEENLLEAEYEALIEDKQSDETNPKKYSPDFGEKFEATEVLPEDSNIPTAQPGNTANSSADQVSKVEEVETVAKSELEKQEDMTSIVEEHEEEKLKEDTLNTQFEKKEKTVVEHHEEERNNDFLKSISLNNRYMFIRNLFKDSRIAFEDCIFELDQLSSFDESVEFLIQGYAKTNKWDMQSDEVKEFLKVLFRRFR